MTAMYTDKQINDFLALAQDVGIGRAMRDLGFPNSWATGKRWAQLRGVEVAKDELRAKAASDREWYKEEEIRTVIQDGFLRVHEELVHNPDLSADDQKKLSDAATKYYNMWANIQGRATTISENRNTDSMDENLQELLAMERAQNMLKKEGSPLIEQDSDVS